MGDKNNRRKNQIDKAAKAKDNWDAITTTRGTFSGTGDTGTVTFEPVTTEDL